MTASSWLSTVHLEPEMGRLLGTMVDFVERAGALALELRAQDLEVMHKGDGLGQALTEADTAISRLMNQTFGPRLIEEETASDLGFEACRSMLADESWSFIGDPIDGTKPFSGGLPNWGTMIAACRGGWPNIGVLSLPAWGEARDAFSDRDRDQEPKGIILASAKGRTWWAPTRNGTICASFAALSRKSAPTYHIGWLPVAAKNFVLDYTQGYFPFGESACISDFASLIAGRLDATTFSSAIWDLAAAIPALEAAGFGIFAWPDLQGAPGELVSMFEGDLYSGDRLWLLAREKGEAKRLAQAIRRAGE